MAFILAEVLENKQVTGNVYSMRVAVENTAGAGQFYMLRSPGGTVLLPRAISVCDRDGESLRFLYQVVGEGTQGFIRLRPGEQVYLMGPLGNGFPVDKLTDTVALVGGGIGVAPMLYTAKALKEKGIAAHCLLGFRDEPFLLEELRKAAASVSVATESGKEGHKGFVTGILEPEKYSAVLVCGPEPMMKAVAVQCMEKGTPVYVSLENKMACGLGACLVCTCTDKLGRNRRTCKEGPVFRGEEIDFDA